MARSSPDLFKWLFPFDLGGWERIRRHIKAPEWTETINILKDKIKADKLGGAWGLSCRMRVLL